MIDMEWRKSYLDLLLVPASMLLLVVYHCWLWYKVTTEPHKTFIGINSAGRRLWAITIIKESEKKSLLAVQTLRNSIMGSTLMATTSILLCSGLGALLSSTYSVKRPLEAMNSAAGSDSEIMIALKYVVLLFFFLFAFLCYSLSIRFINQVSIFVSLPFNNNGGAGGCEEMVSPEYVIDLLEKSFVLNIGGSRIFYAALPLMLWIVGPVLVFLCSAAMVPILYNLDFVQGKQESKSNSDDHDSNSESCNAV